MIAGRFEIWYIEPKSCILELYYVPNLILVEFVIPHVHSVYIYRLLRVFFKDVTVGRRGLFEVVIRGNKWILITYCVQLTVTIQKLSCRSRQIFVFPNPYLLGAFLCVFFSGLNWLLESFIREISSRTSIRLKIMLMCYEWCLLMRSKIWAVLINKESPRYTKDCSLEGALILINKESREP